MCSEHRVAVDHRLEVHFSMCNPFYISGLEPLTHRANAFFSSSAKNNVMFCLCLSAIILSRLVSRGTPPPNWHERNATGTALTNPRECLPPSNWHQPEKLLKSTTLLVLRAEWNSPLPKGGCSCFTIAERENRDNRIPSRAQITVLAIPIAGWPQT